MTKVIRPATLDDIASIMKCASKAGPGIINLPKNQEVLKNRITNSINALTKNIQKPQEEDYLFVLADSHEIYGTCGIYANIGANHPFFVYHIVRKNGGQLIKKLYPENFSEICALYLSPELRKEGFGRLLSLSRFFFIASHRNRFETSLIANMRGYTIKNRSPFWDATGKKLFPMEFDKVMHMRSEDESVVENILQEEPIDIQSLPLEAQECIGKIHDHTIPAITMLKEEGFSISDDIDPIDAGPILTAQTDNVCTIIHSKQDTLADITNAIESSENYIISNCKTDFRACYGKLTKTPQGIAMSKEIADALKIDNGEQIRYMEI